ncbi:hypothetical protein EG68_01439 [Paragonimus skrjabini miyazakii]|uniref:SCP domain-containing protein n=1 Tax=Paragonimus skrjabini miyazakii TaxID=59628 RepID=A0A8S9Z2Y4_9TREM|nr:hypothetical protein EG68_01439 [Paragonimus skrjabini miyazakii]
MQERLFAFGILFWIFGNLQSIPCAAQITDEEKTVALQSHNDLRYNLQRCSSNSTIPPPTRMPLLIWDEDLEFGAQTWAEQCSCDGNTWDERSTERWSSVGQNIAGALSLQSGVESWIDEANQFIYEPFQCESQAAHYTQMIWSETTHIGCGVADCSRFSDYPYGLAVVCHYGPAGNRVGEKPYVAAEQSFCDPA